MTRLKREANKLYSQGFEILGDEVKLIKAVKSRQLRSVVVGLNSSWENPEFASGRLIQRLEGRTLLF